MSDFRPSRTPSQRQAKESADPVALLAAFLKENPEVLALVSK